MNFEDIEINGRIFFDNRNWIIKKVDFENTRVLLHGYGFQKWFDFKEINEKLEQEKRK